MINASEIKITDITINGTEGNKNWTLKCAKGPLEFYTDETFKIAYNPVHNVVKNQVELSVDISGSDLQIFLRR